MPVQDFRIEGAEELEKVLKLLPKELEKKALDSAFKAGANIVAQDAKGRVPVDTGELRDAIVVRKARSRQRSKGIIAVVGIKKPTSRRAHLTEFGTKNAAAKPFLRPAIDIKGQDAIAVIGRKLKENIEKTATKLAGKFETSGLARRRRR